MTGRDGPGPQGSTPFAPSPPSIPAEDTYSEGMWPFPRGGNIGAAIRHLPAESWEKGIGPGIVDKKIMGPDDSNFMLMSVARMESGVKSPPHRHRYAQVFYFLEGTGQMIVDGQAHNVGPGTVARFVHGEEHTVINTGPAPLSLLEVRVLPRGQTVWE